MVSYLRSIFAGVLLAVAVLLSSCHLKHANDKAIDDTQTYFSIIQYAQDQWNTFHGQPFTLMKTVTINGKADSSYVTADSLDWSSVFKIFFESDISDPKYLGHYSFSLFDDDASGTRNLYYEAKDPDLFTRKLLILTDPTTNKILSIYIETSRKKGYDQVDQKLYYSTLKLIQIQRLEKTTSGPSKQEVTEYRFML